MTAPSIRIIAGPCSAESRSQVLDAARVVAAASRRQTDPAGTGIEAFRAGLWKPRTRPGTFEGVGEKGIEWLLEAREKTGLGICTEVASAEHARICLEAGFDILWIGARTTCDPFAVQEIADALKDTGIPVLVKNPISPDIRLWAGAVERLLASGVKDIRLVHRGCNGSFSGNLRNNPQWQMAIAMRSRFPELPIYCDPSHISGDAALVPSVAQTALDLGMDGLMVEVHPNPAAALTDAAQQLDPAGFAEFLQNLQPRTSDSQRLDLAEARARIDEIDSSILGLLASRMQISREIGLAKQIARVQIMQPSRWEEVVSRAVADARDSGLDENFVRRIFELIHEESINQQKTIQQANE